MTLSACLIVKNEEKCLEECISSIKQYVDEIVIVDTGSTDKSLEIADQHGARLYSFPWTDDFAAARNEALKWAKGEWILFIDADELLRPIPLVDVLNTLRDPGKIAYYTYLCPKAGYTEMQNLRLFRKHPSIRYRGAIHETIRESLQLRIAAGDGDIGESRVIFDHRGFDGDQTAKYERNIPLLLKELDKDPPQIWHRHHLADIYLSLGKKAEAESLWKKNIRLLKMKRKMLPRDSLSYIGLLELMLLEKRDVRSLLQEALEHFPSNPQLYWLKGSALMNSRQFVEAVPYLERLIQWGIAKDYDRSISHDRRIFDVQAYEALALCHFRIGKYGASRRYFEIAQEYDPHSIEYTVKARLCAALEKTGNGHSERH